MMAGAKIQHAMWRVILYKLLALGFAQPASGGLERLAELLGHLPGGVAGEAHGLADALERLETRLRSASLDELQADYHRLFGPAGSCQPHETAFSSSPFAQTRELADIAGFYRAFHLTLSEGQPHMPDFAGTELEFMSMAAGKQSYAAMEGWKEQAELCLQGQRSFMRDHLGRWFPAFCRRVRSQDPEGFYGSLATVAAAFLAVEFEFLEVAPDPVGER